MEQKQQDIMIQLHTEIDEDGHKETVQEDHQGTYFMKGGKAVILYTDEQNELGVVKNLITIQPGKVSVKRSGAISMQQIFVVGKQAECMYQHPYGRFLMEIKTTALAIDPVLNHRKNAKVVIEYDMLFQGANRHYRLTMEFMEA